MQLFSLSGCIISYTITTSDLSTSTDVDHRTKQLIKQSLYSTLIALQWLALLQFVVLTSNNSNQRARDSVVLQKKTIRTITFPVHCPE